MSNKNNLIVYCEFEDGKVADVSLELLTKGRQLATTLGVQLEAVVIGDNLKDVEKEIIRYGADTVYKAEDKRLYPYTSNPHAAVLINLFKEIEPQICLMGATCIGRDLGPRVSSCLHSGLTADCTSLEIGNHTDPKTGKEYQNLLYQIRPAFGGNIVATIVNPDCRPQMATVREGVMKKQIHDNNHKGKVVNLDVKKYVKSEDFVVEIIDRHIEKSKVNIKNSPIIVAGGYGMGSKENFDLLFELADTLGAEVGAERGKQLNLFFFYGVNPDTLSSILGLRVYENMAGYQTGIHFGGNVSNLRYMDFDYLSYGEQAKATKAGIGMLPADNEEDVTKVVVPLVKG